jgi:hypothetical protein
MRPSRPIGPAARKAANKAQKKSRKKAKTNRAQQSAPRRAPRQPYKLVDFAESQPKQLVDSLCTRYQVQLPATATIAQINDILWDHVNEHLTNAVQFRYHRQHGFQVEIPQSRTITWYKRTSLEHLGRHLEGKQVWLVDGSRPSKCPPKKQIDPHDYCYWVAQAIFYGIKVSASQEDIKHLMQKAMREGTLAVPEKLETLRLILKGQAVDRGSAEDESSDGEGSVKQEPSDNEAIHKKRTVFRPKKNNGCEKGRLYLDVSDDGESDQNASEEESADSDYQPRRRSRSVYSMLSSIHSSEVDDLQSLNEGDLDGELLIKDGDKWTRVDEDGAVTQGRNARRTAGAPLPSKVQVIVPVHPPRRSPSRAIESVEDVPQDDDMIIDDDDDRGFPAGAGAASDSEDGISQLDFGSSTAGRVQTTSTPAARNSLRRNRSPTHPYSTPSVLLQPQQETSTLLTNITDYSFDSPSQQLLSDLTNYNSSPPQPMPRKEPKTKRTSRPLFSRRIHALRPRDFDPQPHHNLDTLCDEFRNRLPKMRVPQDEIQFFLEIHEYDLDAALEDFVTAHNLEQTLSEADEEAENARKNELHDEDEPGLRARRTRSGAGWHSGKTPGPAQPFPYGGRNYLEMVSRTSCPDLSKPGQGLGKSTMSARASRAEPNSDPGPNSLAPGQRSSDLGKSDASLRRIPSLRPPVFGKPVPDRLTGLMQTTMTQHWNIPAPNPSRVDCVPSGGSKEHNLSSNRPRAQTKHGSTDTSTSLDDPGTVGAVHFYGKSTKSITPKPAFIKKHNIHVPRKPLKPNTFIDARVPNAPRAMRTDITPREINTAPGQRKHPTAVKAQTTNLQQPPLIRKLLITGGNAVPLSGKDRLAFLKLNECSASSLKPPQQSAQPSPAPREKTSTPIRQMRVDDFVINSLCTGGLGSLQGMKTNVVADDFSWEDPGQKAAMTSKSLERSRDKQLHPDAPSGVSSILTSKKASEAVRQPLGPHGNNRLRSRQTLDSSSDESSSSDDDSEDDDLDVHGLEQRDQENVFRLARGAKANKGGTEVVDVGRQNASKGSKQGKQPHRNFCTPLVAGFGFTDNTPSSSVVANATPNSASVESELRPPSSEKLVNSQEQPREREGNDLRSEMGKGQKKVNQKSPDAPTNLMQGCGKPAASKNSKSKRGCDDTARQNEGRDQGGDQPGITKPDQHPTSETKRKSSDSQGASQLANQVGRANAPAQSKYSTAQPMIAEMEEGKRRGLYPRDITPGEIAIFRADHGKSLDENIVVALEKQMGELQRAKILPPGAKLTDLQDYRVANWFPKIPLQRPLGSTWKAAKTDDDESSSHLKNSDPAQNDGTRSQSKAQETPRPKRKADAAHLDESVVADPAGTAKDIATSEKRRKRAKAQKFSDVIDEEGIEQVDLTPSVPRSVPEVKHKSSKKESKKKCLTKETSKDNLPAEDDEDNVMDIDDINIDPTKNAGKRNTVDSVFKNHGEVSNSPRPKKKVKELTPEERQKKRESLRRQLEILEELSTSDEEEGSDSPPAKPAKKTSKPRKRTSAPILPPGFHAPMAIRPSPKPTSASESTTPSQSMPRTSRPSTSATKLMDDLRREVTDLSNMDGVWSETHYKILAGKQRLLAELEAAQKLKKDRKG